MRSNKNVLIILNNFLETTHTFHKLEETYVVHYNNAKPPIQILEDNPVVRNLIHNVQKRAFYIIFI